MIAQHAALFINDGDGDDEVGWLHLGELNQTQCCVNVTSYLIENTFLSHSSSERLLMKITNHLIPYCSPLDMRRDAPWFFSSSNFY